MAIKILGPAPEAVKTVTCKNCAMRLEYALSDTRVVKHTDYTGDSDNYRYLLCPNCKDDFCVSMY